MDFLTYMSHRVGKTRYMLMQSAYYNAPILVRSECDYVRLLNLAKEFGLNIPDPIIIPPPKPIEPPTSFDNNLWIKTLLGEPMIQKDYFVSVYKLEEDDEKT